MRGDGCVDQGDLEEGGWCRWHDARREGTNGVSREGVSVRIAAKDEDEMACEWRKQHLEGRSQGQVTVW